MGSEAIIAIVFAVCVGAFGIYMLVEKKKNQASQTPSSTKTEGLNGYKTKPSDAPAKDMAGFIRFDKIANDMIYQKNGQRYTMVIECKGINYELMSEVEKMAVEEGFMAFLNTLKYPIQLYVQTRSVDLSENIKKYKERVNEFEEKKQEFVTKYNQAEDDIDVSKDEVDRLRREKVKFTNISEYVQDITKYVEKMALNKYMLQRKFYVVLSYNKSDIYTTEKFSNEEYEELCYRELYTRAQGIIGSLMACSVQGRVLKSNDLAELLYISLNKDDEKAINIKEALDAGFYRLYSTTEDVREKRQEMLDEEIKNESVRRVQEAIQEGIKNGTIVSEEELKDQLDKKIDTNAIRMVEASSIDSTTKEEIKKILIDKRREKLAKRKEERKQKQEEETNENVVEKKLEETTKDEVPKKTEEVVIENVQKNEENIVVSNNNDESEDESII